MVTAAKSYLHQTDGCLAIICDFADVTFFQKLLWEEGRILNRHHSALFGNLAVPEDNRFRPLFEVIGSLLVLCVVYYIEWKSL